MGPGMFDGFDKVLIVLAVFAIIGVIFGVWKIVEILIWAF